MSLEKLLVPHGSVPRNKGLAKAFYDLGLIEQWGSGIDKIITACKEAGLPAPSFTEDYSFRVTFWREIYAEDHLRAIGLTERQIQTILHVRHSGQIDNTGYQRIFNVSRKTATRELSYLVSIGLLIRTGVHAKGVKYSLNPRRNRT
jgi:ATP-dependent DNA helicase RecG